MLRSTRIHICLLILIALAAFLLMRVHNAGGAKLAAYDASQGHRLAEAWCVPCRRAADGRNVRSGAKL